MTCGRAPEDRWKHPATSAAVVCQATLVRKKKKGLICSLPSFHLPSICASRRHIFHLLSVSRVPAPEEIYRGCTHILLLERKKKHSVKQNQLVGGVTRLHRGHDCVSGQTSLQLEFALFYFKEVMSCVCNASAPPPVALLREIVRKAWRRMLYRV